MRPLAATFDDGRSRPGSVPGTARRRLARGSFLSIAALALAGCERASPAPVLGRSATVANEPRDLRFSGRNLIFVSLDAVQAAHVGWLGSQRSVTPALDAIARESFAFTNAYSAASWTVPSSMTWFTGVYPSEHRITNKFAVFSSEEKKRSNLKEQSPGLLTLAHVLRANGYATAGFTGNAGVSAVFGFAQGFETYEHETNKFGSFDFGIPRALAWLEKHKDERFFLFLHGYDAHGQNVPSPAFDRRFVEKSYDGKYNGSVQEQEALREEGLEMGALSLRDEDVRFWRALYDERIARVDEKLGRFFRELERLALLERTLVVVVSDHGTELGEHRRLDHGFTLYDELLRVPLLVRLPGQHAGRRIEDRVSSIDLMPTILDLLQVSRPAGLQELRGQSLVGAMKGERVSKDVFAETDYRDYTHKRAIVAPDGGKLILTLETGVRELYDLGADPGEQRDRISSEPERAALLERRLREHWKRLGHDFAARRWERGLNPVYDSQAKPR